MTERERLIELISQKQNSVCKIGTCQMDEIHCSNAELADYLLENGVIVLPLNMIGNTLWFINCDDNIVCDKIDGITISDRHDVYIFLQNSGDEPYELSDIGKFLFLTREEAEKKLLQKGETE